MKQFSHISLLGLHNRSLFLRYVFFLCITLAIVFISLTISCTLISEPEKSVDYILYRLGADENAKSSSTLYFLGSMHVGLESFYPMDATTMKALDSADIVVFESDPSKNVQEIAKAIVANKLTPPTTIITLAASHGFTPEERSTLKDLINKRVGVPGIEQIAPAYLNTVLQNVIAAQAGLSPNFGTETYIQKRSGSKEKQYLETSASVVTLIFRASIADQMKELKNIVSSWNVLHQGQRLLADFYQKQDEAYFNDYASKLKAEEKSFYDAFLLKRNTAWVEKMVKEYMKTGKTYFIVAGMLHFFGEDSVIKLLKKEGYSIRKQ